MGSAVTPALEIEPFGRSHLRDVMKIDALAYPEPWSKRLWLKEIDRDDRIYLVALLDGTVVGYAGALLTVDDAHVTTIATHPDHQRRGIAARLLRRVVMAAIAAGATGLTLEVRAGNVGAQALYRRFGMAPAGLRRNYYQPDNEDAIVMWAHDIDGPDYARRLAAIAEAEGVLT